MTPYEVYKQYVSLKTHFNNEKYDFFTFNGKTNISIEKYNKRNDTYMFEYLSDKLDSKNIIPFLVSNFVIRDSWIGDLTIDMEESISNYSAWKAKMDKIVYVFEDDLNNIKKFMSERNVNFNDLITSNGQHPILFRFVLQKMINIETFVILNRIYDFIPSMDNNLDDIIWDAWSLKFKKYSGFVRVSKSRFTKVSENILF